MLELLLAGGEGLEPPLAESESAVLPLDDPPVNHFGLRPGGVVALLFPCLRLRRKTAALDRSDLQRSIPLINAWSTGLPCGLCVGRLSCVPLRGRRG